MNTSKRTNKNRNKNNVPGKNIPGYARYNITKDGIVYSAITGNKIAVKDFDHFSGRYNLTIGRGKTTRRVTVNANKLIILAYGSTACNLA